MADNPNNIFGSKTGVNLTNKVILNTNPIQILPNSNIAGWNAFHKFLQAKGVINDPSNNSDVNKKIADGFIAEFNSGNSIVRGIVFDHVLKFPQNKIVSENIFSAQKYHKLTDPTVQVDGWVGSQTSQLIYPSPLAYYVYSESDPQSKIPASNVGWIPVTWGNQRYVLSAEKLIQTKGLFSSKDLILYDENIHGDQLQRNAGQFPRNWDTWGNATSISNRSAISINNKTRENIRNKNIAQSQTNVVKNIINNS
jgi:hypothetical protein